MRALLSAVGTRGDVQPLIALAVEVRRRGCDVRLCIPPSFIEWAHQLGLEAVPVGIEMRQRLAGAASGPPAAAPTPDQQRQLGDDLIANQFQVVGSAAEGCDVILGAGTHQYAARSVAEARGVRHVSAVYAPVSLRSPDHAPVAPPGHPLESGQPEENLRRWDAAAKSWNDRARERVNAGRANLGLAPVDDVLRHTFGTEFQGQVMRIGETAAPPGAPPMAEADKKKILHIELPILGGHVLMGTDMLESMGQTLRVGNNTTINLECDSRAEADKLYAALSEGSTEGSGMAPMFWGAYWGSCLDRFGIRWMFNASVK